MPGTIDDRYFEWLYGLVGSVRNRNPATSYWQLAKQLYGKEFVWFVANDDNRIADGKELRDVFIEEMGDDGVDNDWLNLGCSMLEMLIALAGHASFEDLQEKTRGQWFGIFLAHLGLDELNDEEYTDYVAPDVDEALDRVIYRNYAPNGVGGLFPLKRPRQDQRRVELWYQLSAYLLEQG